MKKTRSRSKIILVLLVFLCFAFYSNPVFSQALIMDEIGVLTSVERQLLEKRVNELKERYNVDMAVLLTQLGPYADQNLFEYAEARYFQEGLGSNGFILAVDVFRNQQEFLSFGKVAEISDARITKILEAYASSATYFAGVEAYLQSVEQYVKSNNQGRLRNRYLDEVGLLTWEQTQEINRRLNEISDRYEFDVVIAVNHDLPYGPAHLYAADYFEELGFGYDSGLDGAILFLAMQGRELGFASLGYGLAVFTDKGQDYLDKLFLPQLKNNRFYEAFLSYTDAVEDFLQMAELGTPYDRGNIPLLAEERRQLQLIAIGVSLLIGLIVAFGTAQFQKGKLRSRLEEYDANQYISPGSLILADKSQMFMYRNLSKVVKGESSSAGSKSFSTSSGSKATGHSKKF